MIAVRIAAAATCVIALAACSTSHHATQTTTPAAPSSASSAPPPPVINPLTGEAPSNNPVVAAKIDDTAAGRPQRGIDKADIVYIEQVEGGLTRLLAVFDTSLPTVEPVRSTRVGDPEIALQFGPIVYVASGGSLGELKPLDASPLKTAINDRGDPGFARDPNRSAPFNLAANLAAIGARLKGPKAKDFGMVWSGKVTDTGSVAGAKVDTRVGGTQVVFTWDAARQRYVRVIDGAVQKATDGKVIATPNVVVQFCKITTFLGDIDQSGSPAKVTHTIGDGKVAVFRNGRRIDGTWHRAAVADGTHLTDAHGKPITLAPGGAWFVLVATGTPLT
jgi:Protein of unknown function (DUF3048) N-terminal domain/Protein of unknown function (DUF3048) C-terminal domain